LQEPRTKPLALPSGKVHQRRGEERDLVGLELEHELRFGIAGCGEECSRRESERFRESGEDRRARLRDASCLELGDGTARDADLRGELRLREMQPLAL